MPTNSCEEHKDTERSESVKIVFNQLETLMWKIRDIDGIEKQQNMAMQLFSFLGKAKDLEAISTKLMSLAMRADKKEEEKDDEEDKVPETIEDLYL